ncbi:D-alanyl-lipoteichoic acid biosynthesis protein DltD [Liquorilactobacillus satsumensis]|uniref:D-alanyl-lipoteichoic acid biosynthesis protein DltD n=1 Tax=Liquorilactobacillus satsumensis TaxID=259059 RepID=UPI0021C26E34|nr:D-alanyl-lipoteichoic acid biosynthesis protein DltD [Liquorilactobacillus satsumensis]MCP9327591.1 D-alanyl-lipoteichoic acid biosynthesis protein DltD [Liquorilactobacillus satsumensis]
MKMSKKLFLIFGPVILAAVLLVALFLTPVNVQDISRGTIQRAALSQSPKVFRGMAVKKAAFSKNYVPFFGSSELSRMDSLHPSVLAQKYKRSYRPFLLGAPGTQSLVHYWGMQGIDDKLEGKKAVFIISPQWFVQGGINPDMFNYYYPKPAIVKWLLQAKNNSMDRYAAERLLALSRDRSSIENNATIRIAAGQSLTKFERIYLGLKANALDREDQLFSTITLNNRESAVIKSEKILPATYNFKQLDETAYYLGRTHTTNNSFGVDNTFWNKRLKRSYKKLAGKQANYSYLRSVEFSDFQLVLNQSAKQNMKVLFIIPPVNKRWSEYTGLSMPMLRQFVKKIKYQLNSQGFHNVVDLTKDGGKAYFMQDTIHLGWRGWLAADQYINPFLTKAQPTPKYKINNYFYSKTWQQK